MHPEVHKTIHTIKPRMTIKSAHLSLASYAQYNTSQPPIHYVHPSLIKCFSLQIIPLRNLYSSLATTCQKIG